MKKILAILAVVIFIPAMLGAGEIDSRTFVYVDNIDVWVYKDVEYYNFEDFIKAIVFKEGCPLCGSEERESWWEGQDRLIELEWDLETFMAVHICNNCKNVYAKEVIKPCEEI